MSPDFDPAHTAVIDGDGPEPDACAALLRREGWSVTRAPEATGQLVVVDCWTAEQAPIVTRHRDAHATVTSIGDLLMTRTASRTFGVTGSGGKTTATRMLAAMLASDGRPVASSTSTRAGNGWPSAELLAGVPHTDETELVVELTSTHLAYMTSSPDVAVVTAFWPDHVELHGSLDRYRDAKSTIVRHQGPAGICIVNADDPGARTVTAPAPGRVLAISGRAPVDDGIGVEGGHIVARIDEPVRLMPRAALPIPPPLDAVVLCAAGAALAAGVDPSVVVAVLRDPPRIEHRGRELGARDGVTIVDHSAATTPRKAVGALAGRDLARTVVICGGLVQIAGREVLASRAEEAELEDALRTVCAAKAVIAFGPASARVRCAQAVADLAEACAAARVRADRGDTILFAPMFPVEMATREAFPELMGLPAE